MKKNNLIIVFMAMILIINLIAVTVLIEFNKEKSVKKSIIQDIEENISKSEYENEPLTSSTKNFYYEDSQETHSYSKSYKNTEEDELPEWTKNEYAGNKTYSWESFYGNLTIDEKPAEPGDRIAVFSSKEVLIGMFIVKESGKYGFLYGYGDDLTTQNIEGAIDNEELEFRVYDKSQKKVKKASILNNITPLFEMYSVKNINLKA